MAISHLCLGCGFDLGQPALPGCEPEDVNGDGSVNVLDLIDLLLAFGQNCP